MEEETEGKIRAILRQIGSDLNTFEGGGGGEYMACKQIDSIGLVLPFDWTEKWCPSLTKAFEYFISGQTVCMEGIYVRDVSRFLRSKLRGLDA